MDFSYRFPAVRGIQAGKEYYIAMVPLRYLIKLFGCGDEYILPEYRAQRRLNEARIPVIKDYILDNRASYVFSALATSVDGNYRFVTASSAGDLGILEISMDAHFMIVDGQHRKASIIEAIQEDDTLCAETIPIVFFEDKGLQHSQQMFTDLNKHAVKTSNSIAELYDSRDELAVVTRNVISGIEFLDRYTDKEKDILGKYSSKFFTLNTFYKANKKILMHSQCSPDVEPFLLLFWAAIVDHIVPWRELTNKQISKVDLREQYIITQAIIIQAFGILGHYFFTNRQIDIGHSVAGLERIDWLRSASCWTGRVVRANGKIINSVDAARLSCNYIKRELGIPLTHEDLVYEERLNK